MNDQIKSILEKQSLIIAKQKHLILRLHEELEKRNLKTEEVLLVLQGVTMGLKGTRNGSRLLHPHKRDSRTGHLVRREFKLESELVKFHSSLKSMK